MADAAVRIGLVGLGTIGTGVLRLLQENERSLETKLGFSLRLDRIADIDLETDRGVSLDPYRLSRDWRELVDDPELDLIVELIGGTGVAREIALATLAAGKGLVTANKALLASRGDDIWAQAAQAGCDIGFEASVAGTVPVLRALREGLCADRIESVHGIVNGTCNFILCEMEALGESYAACLKRAQKLGYAEPDPSFDVNGMDSTHKLVILAGLAFGARVTPADVPTEGIEDVTPADIDFARRLGLRIKLLAIAKERDGAIEARVHPTMVPQSSVLARVDGPMNAVEVRGRMSGPTLYYGAGAGALPTASAVVADLMELARSLRCGARRRVPPLGRTELRDLQVRPRADLEGEYYLRFSALDRPGVLSRIAGALGEQGVSLASVLQLERAVQEAVPVVMMTHPAKEAALRRALREIDRMGEIAAPTRVIPIEREL
ncbi:MAG: homoserine dehydrogenase [Myxococcota bacterium]